MGQDPLPGPLKVGDVVGKYVVTGFLGQGGMGVVYTGRHKRLKTQQVAIKVMQTKGGVAGQKMARRFLLEAETAAGIRHDNIVTVLDLDVLDGLGVPFMVMELMPGHDLADELAEHGPMEVERALRLFWGCLGGLARAHEKGIVHKDLKPSNLFVKHAGTSDESLVILDFGVARLVEGTGLTSAKDPAGTYKYMAPEYIEDTSRVSTSVDVYQMGLILIEALSGKMPVTGMLRTQTNLDVPRWVLEEPGLGDLVRRSTAFEQGARFASAGEMRKAIEGLGVVGGRVTGGREAVRGTGEVVVQPRRDTPTPSPATPVGEAKVGGPSSADPGGEGSAGALPQTALLARRRDRVRERVPTEAEGQAADGKEMPTEREASPRARKAVTVGESQGDREVGGASAGWWKKAGVAALAGLAALGALLAVGLVGVGISQFGEDGASGGPGMVRVAAGKFLRGSEDGEEDEKPMKEVYLDEYWIDVFEVTVEDYKACVDARGCEKPKKTKSDNGYYNWGHSDRGKHPINGVDWTQAVAFCKWKGKRLPTEAEWEKAARGVKGEKYAWGDEDGDCSVAVMKKGSESSDDGCGKDRTWEVGSKRGGVSPYGAHDMGGNVWEWVKDRYDENYYGKAPGRNPVNLESGSGRVVRGGGWASYARDLRAANRNGYAPSDAGNGLGFRCAR